MAGALATPVELTIKTRYKIAEKTKQKKPSSKSLNSSLDWLATSRLPKYKERGKKESLILFKTVFVVGIYVIGRLLNSCFSEVSSNRERNLPSINIHLGGCDYASTMIPSIEGEKRASMAAGSKQPLLHSRQFFLLSVGHVLAPSCPCCLPCRHLHWKKLISSAL